MTKYSKALEAAMKEVHRNIPHNVQVTGKTGVAKEKMLEAIAFSKARRRGTKKK
jgi:transcriptional regulator of acetoin/glycerol metabolism